MIDSMVQTLTGFPVEGTMAWAAGWLLRGSLFLVLLALVAGPLARTRSSSVRHLLWAAGFAAVVALPVASVGLPRLEFEVPAAIVPSPPFAPTSPTSTNLPTATSPTGELADATDPSGGEPFQEANVGSLDRGDGVVEGPGVQGGALAWDLSSLPLLLFLLWMAGAGFLLLRFVASMLGTMTIVRRSDRVVRPEWERTLFELSDRMDLAHSPHLVVSDEVALPMTCGLFRPTIVFPRTAVAWSQERLEAVLCHELAHIRRRDLLTHALAHIGSALYWVNPLSWAAARKLRAEGERACDDLVLSLGYRPSAYADHLLQIATFGHRSAAPVAALPMARPGEFEQRLLSILAPIVDRSHPRGWRAGAVALGVLAIAIPFAVLVPAAASGESGGSAAAAEEWPSGDSGEMGGFSLSSQENDTLLSMRVDVHLQTPHPDPHPDPHPYPDPHPHPDPHPDPDPVVHRLEAHDHSPDGTQIDLGAVLNFEGLAAFVHGVTSFAGAVASEAVSEALSGLDPIVSVSIETEGQERVEGTFERTLTLTGPLELEIGTGSGGIDIREANVNRIEIRGRVRVSTRNRGSTGAESVLRRLIASPPIEQAGNEVRIGRIDDRSLQDGVSISYEVLVPVRSSVVANTGSGGVAVRGIEGNLRASTGSGSINLTSIRGEVYTRTGSGSIRASQITGSFDGETGSGSIDLTLQGSGDVSLSTGSGSVSATGVRGALRAESGSGGISVDGEMRGPWALTTGSGSVTVGLPAQASFDLVARAGSGSVDVNHPITLQGRIDQRRQEVIGTVRGGGPDLNIRTGSGGIRIN